MGEDPRSSENERLGGEESHIDARETDRLHRALSTSSRRRVLAVLLDGEEYSLDELATLLAGWAATDQGGLTSAEDRHRIAVSLHHCELPLLEDAGLARYDQDASVVELADVDEHVERALRRAIEGDQSLSE